MMHEFSLLAQSTCRKHAVQVEQPLDCDKPVDDHRHGHFFRLSGPMGIDARGFIVLCACQMSPGVQRTAAALKIRGVPAASMVAISPRAAEGCRDEICTR